MISNLVQNRKLALTSGESCNTIRPAPDSSKCSNFYTATGIALLGIQYISFITLFIRSFSTKKSVFCYICHEWQARVFNWTLSVSRNYCL